MSSATFPVVHKCFQETLLKCYRSCDIAALKEQFDKIKGNGGDKKTILDQAFRDVLLKDAITETEKIESLITLSIAACRQDIATSTIPVVLLGDVFDAVTLEQCEAMFSYVEQNVSIWKEHWIFSSCKNNLLRMCNDLLKRFSRAQNTVFCGRILLFLATFFPFSERSGLNIISEFNLENLTEYETSASDIDGDGSESENIAVKIDHNLYCKFWALQDFFRNPNQCYEGEWKTFAAHLTSVLSAFSSFKLEEQRGGGAPVPVPQNADPLAMETEIEETPHFFAKFLTNPKLLALQLSDANFRRSVLVQCLILFQYLTTTVKFKSDLYNLTPPQVEFVQSTETTVYKLLKETPPNGAAFADCVQHMLKREELWNNWKNDGCKEFKRPGPPIDEQTEPPVKRERHNLGDHIHDATKQNKFYMGNAELTRLWNLCPDNLQACRGEDRNFLPSIESYLENPRDKSDPSYEWRALRLIARQSQQFFSPSPSPNKVSDYLENVRKKLHETKSKQNKVDVEPKIENDSDLMMDKEDGLVEDDGELLKADHLSGDDKNVHKTVTATDEQLRELCVIINKDWERLAAKLGYKKDEIQHFAQSKATPAEQCRLMLDIWYQDEGDDASLENLCYTIEGLELTAAADCIKRILEPVDKMEDISD